MPEHTFLVAFVVDTAKREDAEEYLRNLLPDPNLHEALDCWWIAEDDRRDGSDNDSAFFVEKGRQWAAFNVLYREGLTGPWNNPTKKYVTSRVDELARDAMAALPRGDRGAQDYVRDLVMLMGRVSMLLSEPDLTDGERTEIEKVKQDIIAAVLSAMKED